MPPISTKKTGMFVFAYHNETCHLQHVQYHIYN